MQADAIEAGIGALMSLSSSCSSPESDMAGIQSERGGPVSPTQQVCSWICLNNVEAMITEEEEFAIEIPD
ncbi:hypothetical protein L484_015416 [Morus notabilis]|uniref:Uncharacterized protein n=1 Tax=Morus notabilis TaxID=981085 RepID=W9RNZ0_9ROSA|nr:hypothetical protein L484_015416 [Morus notabilis]